VCGRRHVWEWLASTNPTAGAARWIAATWFSIVHRKVIRRGVFRSIVHLKDAIQRFLDAWNANCHPFAWVKTAHQILASAKPKAISGPVH